MGSKRPILYLLSASACRRCNTRTSVDRCKIRLCIPGLLMRLGTPRSPCATRVMLLGAGELGKEVIIALQRLGVEVIAVDRYANPPGHQWRHRAHVIDIERRHRAARPDRGRKPHLVVPEIEAIATETLLEIEAAGLAEVQPTARAANLTMNREASARLAAKRWVCRPHPMFLPTASPRCPPLRKSLSTGHRQAGDVVVRPGPVEDRRRQSAGGSLGLRLRRRTGQQGPRHCRRGASISITKSRCLTCGRSVPRTRSKRISVRPSADTGERRLRRIVGSHSNV